MKNHLTLNRFEFLIISCILLLGTITAFAQPDNRFRQPHSRNQFEVLVYTSPDKWHNLTEPVALLALQDLAQKHAFGFTWTTVNSMFNDKDLAPPSGAKS